MKTVKITFKELKDGRIRECIDGEVSLKENGEVEKVVTNNTTTGRSETFEYVKNFAVKKAVKNILEYPQGKEELEDGLDLFWSEPNAEILRINMYSFIYWSPVIKTTGKAKSYESEYLNLINDVLIAKYDAPNSKGLESEYLFGLILFNLSVFMNQIMEDKRPLHFPVLQKSVSVVKNPFLLQEDKFILLVKIWVECARENK